MLRYTRDSASVRLGCRGGHTCTCGQKKAAARPTADKAAPRGPMTADRLSERLRQHYGRPAPLATLDGKRGPMTAARMAALIILRRQQEAPRRG